MSAYECCPNYSYSKRGYSCSSVTAALTSNRKFLPPNAQVYKLQRSYMLQYPGYSGDFITSVPSDQKPENIKAYNKSNDLPSNKSDYVKKCSSCCSK